MAMTGIFYRLSPSAPARHLALCFLAAAVTLATVACSKASIIDNGQGGAAGASAGAGGGGGTAGTATGAGGAATGGAAGGAKGGELGVRVIACSVQGRPS